MKPQLAAFIEEMRRKLPDNPDHDAHTAFCYINPRQLREWIAKLEAEASESNV